MVSETTCDLENVRLGLCQRLQLHRLQHNGEKLLHVIGFGHVAQTCDEMRPAARRAEAPPQCGNSFISVSAYEHMFMLP